MNELFLGRLLIVRHWQLFKVRGKWERRVHKMGWFQENQYQRVWSGIKREMLHLFGIMTYHGEYHREVKLCIVGWLSCISQD